MDKNCPCVVCSKLYELNGLVCVEINMESWSIKELMGLMLNVLTK